MRWRALVPFVVTGLVVVMVASLANADRARVPDPDDTVGALDVKAVKYERPRGEPPAWTVVTFSRWKVPSLWDRGYVFVYFDTQGLEHPNYYALIRSTGNRMVGELFSTSVKAGRPDVKVSDLRVWRKGPVSVSVRVPLKRMDFGPFRTFYRWWVVTVLTTNKCPNSCIDRVPDEGSVQQWRPGMSPTPEPTPTDTPTPTP
jgi:hypothetical protein